MGYVGPRRVVIVSQFRSDFQTIQSAIDACVAKGASASDHYLVQAYPGVSRDYTPVDGVDVVFVEDIAINGLLNNTQANTAKWRRALGGVISGTAPAKVLLIGDSNLAGAGAGDNGTYLYGNAFKYSYASQMARYINRKYCPCSIDSFVGGQRVALNSIPIPTYDPRFTATANWSVWNARALGGDVWTIGVGQTGTLAFTPTGAFDRFEIIHMTNTGNSSASVNVDGGADVVTLTGNAALGLATSGVQTVAHGTHTINIVVAEGQAGNGMPIAAIMCYDSTAPPVQILQAGWAGGRMYDLANATATYEAGSEYPFLDPDLVVLSLTVNDSVQSKAAATYKTELLAVINRIKTEMNESCDIILMTGLDLTGTDFDATSVALQQKVVEVAEEQSLAYIDLHSRWRPKTTNVVDGYHDDTHPNRYGYADWAKYIADAIMSV